jgi:GntR family transcriptional regulator
LSIDSNSAVPIFQQIADEIRRAIAAGVYQPGEPIPSIRATSLKMTVNPNTVQRAYEQLEREGLVQARKGLGLFVTNKGVQHAQSKSESALTAAFAQAIRSALAAGMPPQRVAELYAAAWNHANHPTKVQK